MVAILRRLIVLAAATGVACALPAAAARASGGYVDIVGVGSPASDVGALYIDMTSSAPVVGSSITAELYAPGAASPALTVTGFALTEGDNTGGFTQWTVSTPISQANLPLGTYTVAVQAQDTAGDTGSDADAGNLKYLIQPTVTLSASPAMYSYGQTVTFSGTDEGLYPDGDTLPLAGQSIALTDQPECTCAVYQLGTATSATDGSFSFTFQAGVGIGADLTYGATASAAATATAAASDNNNTVGSGIQTPVKIAAAVSPAATPVGGTATISGTVTVQEGSAWKPVEAGELVQVSQTPYCYDGECGECSTSVCGLATTNASGQFSLTVNVSEPMNGTALAMWEDAWLKGQASINVPASDLPVAVYVSAQKTVHGRVFATGCPSVTVNNADPAKFAKVTLEDAYAPSGPWQKLTSGQPSFASNSPYPDSEGCFSASLKATRPFVRAVSAGDSAYHAGVSAASRVMPVARSSVRVVGIGPRHVARGGKVELYATFSHGTALDPPTPARSAQIQFRARGSRTWKVISTVRLASDDSLTAFVRLYRSGYLRVRYPGNLVTEPSESASYYIRMTARR
jgi:hypothetical protein